MIFVNGVMVLWVRDAVDSRAEVWNKVEDKRG